MKKKNLKAIALTAFSMVIMASCSNDSPDGPVDPINPDGPVNEMEKLTPTESKKFLEKTATEAEEKFRAADQKELINLASYFTEKYADLNAPTEFEIENEAKKAPEASYIRTVAKALSSGNASRAGSAAIEYVYSLNFPRFKGIYEPGATRWMRTGDSKDIIFRFKDAAGKQCELKASASDAVSEGSISYTDEDYYYDYDNDDYSYLDEKYTYKFRVPKEVNISLTCGGDILVTAKVNSDINISGHTMNITANTTAANLEAAVKIEGTDTRVTQTSSFSVSGELLVNSSATVNGNRLCDIDYYQDEKIDVEDKAIAMLKNGTATLSVLNKVRIDATASYNRDVYKALSDCWDSWEYESQNAAETDVKKAIEALNSNLKAEVRYNNTTTVQATLLWKYSLDKWGNDWEYYIDPLIKFNADETTYSFDEYFENGFASVQDEWESLIKSYEKVWDNASK